MDVTNSKSGDKSDKDFSMMPREQQFLELVRRKLRKANKKMTRISQLEASNAGKQVNLNEEQKKLLASKELTSTLVSEFTDLQTQMSKLIDENKIKDTQTTPAPASDATTEKKERQPRKERKKKDTTESGTNASSSTSAPSPAIPSTTSTQNDQAAPSSSTPQVSSESNASQGQAQESSNQTAQRGDRPPKPKKQWEFQKDIYLAQFKSTFTEVQNGMYVAVSEGKLLGPFETLEEMTAAVGGDKNSYFTQVGGDESKNPIKRINSGRRSGDRERGPRREGSRDGAPRGDRDRDQRPPRRDGPRDPNARGGFNNPRRGESGSGSRGQSSPSQGRQQS